MNPYKRAEEEIRRMREISMRTGIPMIVATQEEAEIASEVTWDMIKQATRRSAVMVDYLALMGNPCREVSARDMVNPNDSMRAALHGHHGLPCSELCDRGHQVDPKERTPLYVETSFWQVINGPSAKEMRDQ